MSAIVSMLVVKGHYMIGICPRVAFTPSYTLEESTEAIQWRTLSSELDLYRFQ